MNKEELLKLSPGELTDLGICPTCFSRENGGEDTLVFVIDIISTR